MNIRIRTSVVGMHRLIFSLSLFICAALSSAGHTLAVENPWAPSQTTVPTVVRVAPIAEVRFPDGINELHLFVPPANSTIPSSGLRFEVRGNAIASISAAPNAFLQVQHYVIGPSNVDLGPRFLGRAVNSNGDLLGYSLQVEFPVGETKSLPLTNGQGTTPLTVDMPAVGGVETGFLHLIASHRWTPTGGMPPVGDYIGSIILTVGAAAP